METERSQLTKRHSFPYTKIYTWNMLNSGSQIQVDIPIDQMKSAPVISSDGSSAEREARLEDAILWIRKELVCTTLYKYSYQVQFSKYIFQKEIRSILEKFKIRMNNFSPRKTFQRLVFTEKFCFSCGTNLTYFKELIVTVNRLFCLQAVLIVITIYDPCRRKSGCNCVSFSS